MNGNHTFRDIKGEKYFKVEQSSLPLFLAIQFESYDKIVFFVNSNIEIIKLKDSFINIGIVESWIYLKKLFFILL